MSGSEFCNHVRNLAIKSILYEVATTPKPGLVDRRDSGAHDDMDFFTFLNSASVLSSYFEHCTEAGMTFKGTDYENLLGDIRPIGIMAEEDMFRVTKGVNTHKGIIFSQGIIAAAVGSLFRQNCGKNQEIQSISQRVREMAKGITNELEEGYNKDVPTYGERLYIQHGIKGIRGEVESGFRTVLEYALPVFSNLIKKDIYHINDILIQTLLHLMVNTEDGNILGRHGIDALHYCQNRARKALQLGGYLTPDGRGFIEDMNVDFIEKNISPGGAADLLAVTLMLYMMENGDIL